MARLIRDFLRLNRDISVMDAFVCFWDQATLYLSQATAFVSSEDQLRALMATCLGRFLKDDLAFSFLDACCHASWRVSGTCEALRALMSVSADRALLDSQFWKHLLDSGELDLHGLSHPTALVMVSYAVAALRREFRVITGQGHHGVHERFAMRRFIEDHVREIQELGLFFSGSLLPFSVGTERVSGNDGLLQIVLDGSDRAHGVKRRKTHDD